MLRPLAAGPGDLPLPGEGGGLPPGPGAAAAALLQSGYTGVTWVGYTGGTGGIKVLQGIHRGTGDIKVCFTGGGEVAPGGGLRQHGDPLSLLHQGGLHQEVQ